MEISDFQFFTKIFLFQRIFPIKMKIGATGILVEHYDSIGIDIGVSAPYYVPTVDKSVNKNIVTNV